jgi:glycosyltransferase involved in cell wall biosynthesis
MRAALLTNILPPYRMPVYHDLAGTPGWRWRFFTNAATEVGRSWRVDSGDLDVEQVRSFSFRRRFAFRRQGDQVVTAYLPLGLLGALRRFEPDVVVSAELGARTLLALLYCRVFGVPLVIWSYHSRVSSSVGGRSLQTFRRLLLSCADAVVGMGAEARRVLSDFGVPSERIFDAPNAHDRDGLEKALADADSGALRTLQQAGGGREHYREHVALVVGRLVHAKGIEPLFDSWDDLPPSVRGRWTLLFVGDGPLAPRVQSASRSRSTGEIFLIPAVQPEELAAYYAAADLLIFPSLGDPWGLVVNEALACGLPVLCSSRAGCATDLVLPGRNGWIVDPLETPKLTATLLEALDHPDLSRLGECARGTARRFSPERMADGIRRAVTHAAAARPRRAHQAAPAR